jgi:hypothetical protein
MGTDFNIKPVGTPVANVIKPAPEATRTAVQTELPIDKSVTAAQNSSATTTSANYRPPPPGTDQYARSMFVDRAAAQIVFVTIDKATNLVVSQYPEESKLRARAYQRAQENAKQDIRPLETDRSA